METVSSVVVRESKTLENFFDDERVKVIKDVNFEAPSDVYCNFSYNVDDLERFVKGGSSFAFDFVKFDLFRDFFQILGLFLSQFTWPSAFYDVFGRLSNIAALDVDVALPSVPSSTMFFIMVVVFIICYIVLYFTMKDDPDAIRHGAELVDWEDRSKKQLYIRRIVITILITLYLPITRSTFEVFMCTKPYAEIYDPTWTSADAIAEEDGVIPRGDCTGTGYTYACIAGVISVILTTILLPLHIYRLIQKSKPQPRFFDAEGKPKVYTAQDYNDDLTADPSPYQFLYRGYERRWAFYKVIVMGIKAALSLALVILPSYTTNKLLRAVVTCGILFVFATVSFVTSPFLSRIDDTIDQCSRVTTLVTGIFAFVTFGGRGTLMTLLHTANLLCMIFLTLLANKILRRKWRSVFGLLEWQDKQHFEFDLDRERKIRIWHPFWRGLFLNDDTYQDQGERLNEQIRTAATVGADVYRKALLPVPHQVGAARRELIDTLEGVDVFWDGIPEDGHLDSRSRFGKLYIEPFPFRAVIVWDDSNDYAFLSDDEDILRLCAFNKDPAIRAKVHIRKQLRALAGQQVYYYHQETHSKSVRKDNDQTVQYRVLFTFERGTLSVGANSKLPFSAGFSVSVHYRDGRGSAHGHSWSNESATIKEGALGITPAYNLTDNLSRLLTHPENSGKVTQGLKEVARVEEEYRRNLTQARVKKLQTLSDGFWYYVYSNPNMSLDQLNHYLQTVELSAEMKDLPVVHEKGFDFVYARLRYYNSHPALAFWFCLWTDFWERNNCVKFVQEAELVLCEKYPTALCYHVMPQSDLIAFLNKHQLRNESGKGKVSDVIIDQLYLALQKYVNMDHFEDLTSLWAETGAAPAAEVFEGQGHLAEGAEQHQELSNMQAGRLVDNSLRVM
eukprot:GCRY01002215.1.p1 GENE.GCRY01002215.1~~GCRY01002215.1.p1  ORF type:complete len:900 (-),score=256.01 GCRY01002215.1:389-3088(-)